MNTKTLNLIQAVNDALDIALTNDPNVLIYGEDCGFEGGVFRATQGLQAKHGQHRVLDAPICEAAMAGLGCGLAIYGKKPVVEIQFDGFIFPALQQIFCQIARYRNRSRGRFSAPVVFRVPMGGGIRALEHHSEAIESLLGQTPGLKIVYPSNPYDAKGLLLAAINSKDPVIFCEPKKLYRSFKQEIPEAAYEVEIGKANIVNEGNDVTLVTYGSTFHECLKAVQELGDSVSVELIDLRTIAPIDWETVLESVKKTSRLIVAHEAVKTFSTSAEIITRVVEEAFMYLSSAPVRVTGYDIIVPYARGEKYHMVTAEDVKNAITKLMSEQA